MKTEKHSLSRFKSILILVIILPSLLLSCINEKNREKAETDLEKAGLKGKIKSVVDKEFLKGYKSGKDSTSVFVSTNSSQYNKNGYLMERNVCDSAGSLTLKETHEYNIKNELTRSHEYNVTPSGINEKDTRYKYNEFGKEIEICEYNPNGSLLISYTTQYDKNGNITERNSISPDGHLNGKSAFVYDSKGNMIEANYFNSNDLEYKDIHEYDDNGNNDVIRRYDSSGNLEKKFVHQYSDQKKLTNTTVYNPEGNISSEMTVKYDDKGKIIEKRLFDKKNKIDTQELIVYDEKENVIERTNYTNGILVYKYKYYNYDKAGNPIRITIIDPEKTLIIERDIKYY